MRSAGKPHLTLSLILILLALVITIYPVGSFYFTKDLEAEYLVTQNSTFDYGVGIPAEDNGTFYGAVLEFTYLSDGKFIENGQLYAFSAPYSLGSGLSPYFPFEVTGSYKQVSYSSNTQSASDDIIQALFPLNDSVNIFGNFYKIPSTGGLHYDPSLFGFFRTYEVNRSLQNTTLFMSDGNYYVMWSGVLPFSAIYQLFPTFTFPHNTSIQKYDGITLFLTSSSVLPRDQHWIYGLSYSFWNVAFPAPQVMLGVAVVTLTMWMRKR